jgi:hypothetical protein
MLIYFSDLSRQLAEFVLSRDLGISDSSPFLNHLMILTALKSELL